ncbi:MAG: metalloregulator ArsR/SmtB family transcription factor [Caldicoprobacterales bacterium]|jgi:ArsR family transcriptional regulator|nr:winged helix-turn-helix transcriptional regulator [Clostridiales bacterium]
MEITKLLKAIGDESRFKILRLLLQHNYCVRALSKRLGLSESAISQHIKVLKEVGLLVGVKKGYYMHYDVNRDILHKLATQIKVLAEIEREVCDSLEIRSICHSKDREKGCAEKRGNCKGHKS